MTILESRSQNLPFYTNSLLITVKPSLRKCIVPPLPALNEIRSIDSEKIGQNQILVSPNIMISPSR